IFAASERSPSSAETAVLGYEVGNAEKAWVGLQPSASATLEADMRRPFLADVSGEPKGPNATASRHLPESRSPILRPPGQHSAWILLAQLLQPAAELLRSQDAFPDVERGGKSGNGRQVVHTTGEGTSKLCPGRVASPLGTKEASSDSESRDVCGAGGEATDMRHFEVDGQLEGYAPSLNRLIYMLNLLVAAGLYDGGVDPPRDLDGSGN
ncbi:hypothetical protein Vretimale_12611, partial [Volvox reticuliferus]